MPDTTVERLMLGDVIDFERDDSTLGKRTCSIQVDDPQLDATDGAHPAYWRGHDFAIDRVAEILEDVANGKEFHGFGHAKLNAVVNQLLGK